MEDKAFEEISKAIDEIFSKSGEDKHNRIINIRCEVSKENYNDVLAEALHFMKKIEEKAEAKLKIE